jgi:hypothetical protein
MKVAEASRAFMFKVENGNELPSALKRAIEHVRKNRIQASVDIGVAY